MRVVIRTNGRGNAWPLELGVSGDRHQALMDSALEYANTSLSILGYDRANDKKPRWEVLFDVGQGVLPFLVQHGNRLPDAVLLSHPHFDHVSGLDWLGASFRRNGPPDAKLPVFTTSPCWNDVTSRFPWIKDNLELQALEFRKKTEIDVAPGLFVTAFPVFHGAYAPGACLMLLEYVANDSRVKAILSGDLLCPLIEPNDYELLYEAHVAYVDANTRFPCPSSSHWSILQATSGAKLLQNWIAKHKIADLLAPHDGMASLPQSMNLYNDLYWSIDTFVQRVAPQSVALVHYSGYEDVAVHNEPILTDAALYQWICSNLDAQRWHVPLPGHEFVLNGEV
jgi:Beta-lactamase superfamily domain